MCLSAIYWARLKWIFIGATRRDAAQIGFQDENLYRELRVPMGQREIPVQATLRVEARRVMMDWFRMDNREGY